MEPVYEDQAKHYTLAKPLSPAHDRMVLQAG